jgi:hypothetical protein
MSEQGEVDKKEEKRAESLKWARRPDEDIEKLKEKAREGGLDEEKLLLGYLLELIKGDDIGSFSYKNRMRGREFEKEEGEDARIKILERINWELRFPYTPQELKGSLEKTKEYLTKNVDWDTELGYKDAHNFWEKNVKERADVLAGTPESRFREAYEYYRDVIIAPFRKTKNDMSEQEEIDTREEKIDWPEDVPNRAVRMINENFEKIKGFDKEQLILGYILRLMTGDDIVALNTANFYLEPRARINKSQEEKIRMALNAGNRFAKRLKWEEQQEVVPEKIKRMIGTTLDRIQRIECDSFENLQKIQEVWQNELLSKVMEMKESDELGVGTALKQYDRYEGLVRERKDLEH